MTGAGITESVASSAKGEVDREAIVATQKITQWTGKSTRPVYKVNETAHFSREEVMRTGMMKPGLVGLALALILMWSGAKADGVSGTQNIKNLLHRNNQMVEIVGANGNWQNPDVCPNASRLLLRRASLVNQDVYKEMFAMLLGAHLAGRPIAAKVSGCAVSGGVSYPVIVQLTVR